MESVNPIEILKEEMENDSISYRINAIHRIRVIGTVLGPEAVKSQLLPYLDTLLKKEDDEVLFALARESKTLVDILGPHYTSVFPMLEYLATVEETVVRDECIKSLGEISKNLNDKDIQDIVAPMIYRLLTGDSFTSKVSGLSLIGMAYKKSGNMKDRFRTKFIELASEETPMIRRCIAVKIGELASIIDKQVYLSELFQLYKGLMNDDQDSVRVLALENLKDACKVFTKEEIKTHIIPIIIQASQDKSWRVKLALSKTFSELAELCGKDIAENTLSNIFTTLLKDSENEVRHAACESLKKFLKFLSLERLNNMLPYIYTLAKDPSNQVRAVGAEVLAVATTMLGKDIVWQKFFPLITELLQDKETEVKINVLKAVVEVVKIVGGDALSGFEPSLKQCMADTKWRVRFACLDCIIQISCLCSNYLSFVSQYEPLVFNYLTDQVFSVRELGIKKLPLLITAHKQEWVIGRLLPKLADVLNKESSYLIKETALYSVEMIATSGISFETFNEKGNPLLVKAMKDKIPNNRFVALKIIRRLFQKMGPKYLTPEMKTIATELSTKDLDPDVKYYAGQLLKA